MSSWSGGGRRNINVTRHSLSGLNLIDPVDGSSIYDPLFAGEPQDLSKFANKSWEESLGYGFADSEFQQPSSSDSGAATAAASRDGGLMMATATATTSPPGVDQTGLDLNIGDGEFSDFNFNAYLGTNGSNFSEGLANDLSSPFTSSTTSPQQSSFVPPPSRSGNSGGTKRSSFDTTANATPISPTTSATLTNKSPDNLLESAAVTAEEDKRRRNTAASARFRIKKKAREQALEKREKELADEVATMKTHVEHLEAENKWLKNIVMEKNGVSTKDAKKVAKFMKRLIEQQSSDEEGDDVKRSPAKKAKISSPVTTVTDDEDGAEAWKETRAS